MRLRHLFKVDASMQPKFSSAFFYLRDIIYENYAVSCRSRLIHPGVKHSPG